MFLAAVVFGHSIWWHFYRQDVFAHVKNSARTQFLREMEKVIYAHGRYKN